MSRIAALFMASLVAVGSAYAEGKDIDKVNGAIVASAGESYGKLDTVNGAIRIEEGVSADSAETVNGSITVAAKAHVGSLEAVNGGIRIGEGAVIARGVETVNGGITLASDAAVGGTLETVNGSIRLDHAVAGAIKTVNGDIVLGNGSLVRGNILIDQSHSWSLFSFGKPRVPKVVIGASSKVEGELVFKREVELWVHDSATVGKVTGATAKAYSGEQPPEE
ncbi:MAG: hypothetical protein Q8L45_02405 [Xanthomonadaceae bacterium]|nr:hypothetical protein [Xanthomonadaceae bacterium]MDP2185059.1 hypothetical protein [Xanthomonadales bacterium]MDZ4115094.1 hypothetical protein [Xanthomonadaceae bacterium]MDZ4377729.1 hypothetical protein [Xanthomonadaceae bacterium]